MLLTPSHLLSSHCLRRLPSLFLCPFSLLPLSPPSSMALPPHTTMAEPPAFCLLFLFSMNHSRFSSQMHFPTCTLRPVSCSKNLQRSFLAYRIEFQASRSSGDGCRLMWMHLKPQNYTLKKMIPIWCYVHFVTVQKNWPLERQDSLPLFRVYFISVIAATNVCSLIPCALFCAEEPALIFNRILYSQYYRCHYCAEGKMKGSILWERSYFPVLTGACMPSPAKASAQTPPSKGQDHGDLSEATLLGCKI